MPIHECENTRLVESYSGFAKLSALSKLFVSIIVRHLIFAMKSYISPSQYAYSRGRSTTSNLLELASYIFKTFSRGAKAIVIYMDFSKVFDKINHKLLTLKLQFSSSNKKKNLSQEGAYSRTIWYRATTQCTHWTLY